MKNTIKIPLSILGIIIICCGIVTAQYSGGPWDGGQGATKDNTTTERIPYKDSNEEFSDSPLYYDVSENKVVSDVTLEVPGGSIKIGEVVTISEGTNNLLLSDEVNSENYAVVKSLFDSTGSSAPYYLDLGAAASLDVQTTDTTTITDNPLTYSLTGTVVLPNLRQVNAITYRTGAVMTNVRGKVVDNATGVVIRYIPSKAIYDAGTGGISFISGDNKLDFISTAADSPGVINLGVSPFLIEYDQQLDFEIVADSVNMKGDATDVPYQVAIVQDGPVENIAKEQDSSRVQTTGLLEGGVVSIASSTTVDWTSGRGLVVDYSDPEDPDVSDVIWDAVSGQAVTNVATDGTTLFGYNSAGTIVQKLSTAVAIEDSHDIIFFGSATHIGGSLVAVITAPGNMAYDGIGSFSDFINLVIGPANIDGNVYDANGTNMNIDCVGGNAYMMGSNFRTDPALSDIITLANDTTVSFNKVYRSAGAGLSIVYDGAATTTIDPSSYDNGSGTLQTTTAGYWTIQRIFRSRTGGTFVAYGQEQFATKTLALDALGKEVFVEKSPLPFTLFRCSLLVQQGASDLSDTAEAEFFAQSSFRLIGAQSASATIPGVTSPGGADSNIQYNDSNTFAGSAKFCYFDTTDVTNVSIHSGSTSGQANLVFRDNGAGNKAYLRYDQDDDIMRLFTLSGVDIELTPGAGGNVGVNEGEPDSTVHIYTNNALTDDTTGVKLEQDGAGDAAFHLSITGGDVWSFGIDQSDGERWKLAPNTDVGSSSVIDASSSDINFISGRTNLANTGTTTFLTMDSPTATGLVGLLFHDNLDTLHGSLAYNFSLDQLQINSVIGGINLFTGLGLTKTNTSSASQNYNRLVSGGASCVAGFQVENTTSGIDLEMIYNQGTDRSYIIDRSASGLEVEAVNGVLFLKSATDDILLDVSSNAGRIEILGLNHTDSHSILNIATSDGDVDFFVGEDTPIGNVSAVGGAIYFRDAEADSGIFVKKSAGAASTSGWGEVGDITGPASSVDNSIATFDSTTGKIIQQVSGLTAVNTGAAVDMVFKSPSPTGGVAIEFFDSGNNEKFSISHNDNTDANHIISDVDLNINVLGSALDIDSGDDITIDANSGANLITLNDDFAFGDTTTNAILRIKAPSATATSGITLQNNTSTAEVEIEYDQDTDIASMILHNEVPLSITGADHDEDDILLTLASQGTNGAQTSKTVSNRTPVGNNTANPGSRHTTVDGVGSGEWIHTGSSANNTDWKKFATGERTLVYNVDVEGIDQNEFILIGEYRVEDTGETGDYGTDFACNNQHAAIEVNSLTGSGVVTFTGVSMSESSGIPTATTEDVTVDATGKYQTDKKWLEVTNIDIPVGITAINYDVEVLGYLDMQNADFTITGMRIDALSKGNDADISLHMTKVQDDGSKKCSLVEIEHYGYDAKDDLIVDDLRTGGDDRSYTATTSIWANGTNACLKVDDYSTYFTADENIIEGMNKAEGIIIHFDGTDGGNIKNVQTLNLHLTIQMN